MKINYEGTLMDPDPIRGLNGNHRNLPAAPRPNPLGRAAIVTLYVLAITTGVGGVLAGGIPLATYALARLKNPGFGYYANLPLISTAENTLIFSLMLLIFVHIGHVLGAGLRRPAPKPDSSAHNHAPANPVSWQSEAPQRRKEETADERLARLLK
jgi:hypothetical protein